MYSKGQRPAHLLFPCTDKSCARPWSDLCVFTVHYVRSLPPSRKAPGCPVPEDPRVLPLQDPEWNELLFPCFFHLRIPGFCCRVCTVEYVVRMLCELSSSHPSFPMYLYRTLPELKWFTVSEQQANRALLFF